MQILHLLKKKIKKKIYFTFFFPKHPLYLLIDPRECLWIEFHFKLNFYLPAPMQEAFLSGSTCPLA